MNAIGPADNMRDHWWWRPGWHVGRKMYTWHVTFDDHPSLHELVLAYQVALSPLTGLDLIPMRWLHLTMQGVAFADETNTQEISDMVEATRKNLARRNPVPLTVGPAIVDPEAIMLKVTPSDALAPVRSAIRSVMADVRGAEKVPESSEWSPHISLAYSNGDGVAAPFIAAVGSVRNLPVNLTVSKVDLIELSRDTHLYRWTTRAEVLLSR